MSEVEGGEMTLYMHTSNANGNSGLNAKRVKLPAQFDI